MALNSAYKYTRKSHTKVSSLNLLTQKKTLLLLSSSLSLFLSRIFEYSFHFSTQLTESQQLVMESKPSNTIKILYSYGGKIRLRSTDGELRYVGGHTRVLAVDRSISFSGSHLRVLSSLSFEFLSSLRSLYSSILLIFCRIDGEA